MAAFRTLAALACLAGAGLAQQGDVAGEEQPPLPEGLAIPPAPALSAEQELATFAVPEGFVVELVASEPLVRDPVAITFGADGRLWVVEMSGYMNDLAGSGEAAPVGTIAVLEDEDGDGRMDQRTEFARELVLPRALALTRGGALVIAPPELLFLVDEDEDGVADARTVVERGLAGIASPEHAINGLLPTLDNALACANVPWRYAWRDGRFQREATAGGGQWGIAQDDLGLLYYNDNSDPLRGDLIPSRLAARNPDAGLADGVNVRLAEDRSVRPSRVTPGVNRGYRPGFLVDGKLAQVTAACAPWIHRGGTFPPPWSGAAFVCEPAANLVLAYGFARGAGGEPRAHPLRRGELDFLTSTDERFRPVALCDGPDGALYVADLYRGLIQHRLFVTTFLARQVQARGLEQPLGRGRVWRVRHAGAERTAAVDLSEARWIELAAALESPNGWVRDRAQQVFVEEGAEEAKAKDVLRAFLAATESPLAKVHALWALHGMRALTPELLHAALADPDERVRATAVRTGEQFAGSDPRMLARWNELAREIGSPLRTQVLLSLGELHTDDAERALAGLLSQDASVAAERSRALSSLAKRETAFLEILLDSRAFEQQRDGRAELIELLARTLARQSGNVHVARVLDLVVEGRRPVWQRDALVAGLLAGRSEPSAGRPAALRLSEEPRAYPALVRLASQVGRERGAGLAALASALSWPGHPLPGEIPVRPLDPAEQVAFGKGRNLFANVCAGCHQSSGLGQEGLAPPLRGSEWVLGEPATLGRILLAGLAGPIEVRGATWQLEMPAVVATDEELAGVLTYVRREWGHSADPVPASLIRQLRAELGARKQPFTAAELRALAER